MASNITLCIYYNEDCVILRLCHHICIRHIHFSNNLHRNCIKKRTYNDYELKRQKACSILLDLIHNIIVYRIR